MITTPITNLAEQLSDMADGFNDCPAVLHSNDIAELKELLYAAATAIEAKQQGPGEAVEGKLREPWEAFLEGYTRDDLMELHERLVTCGISKFMEGSSNKAADRRYVKTAITEAWQLLGTMLATAPQVEAKRQTGDDHPVLRKALANPDWCGPAAHFRPEEEVIQTRVLRALLKQHDAAAAKPSGEEN